MTTRSRRPAWAVETSPEGDHRRWRGPVTRIGGPVSVDNELNVGVEQAATDNLVHPAVVVVRENGTVLIDNLYAEDILKLAQALHDHAVAAVDNGGPLRPLSGRDVSASIPMTRAPAGGPHG